MACVLSFGKGCQCIGCIIKLITFPYKYNTLAYNVHLVVGEQDVGYSITEHLAVKLYKFTLHWLYVQWGTTLVYYNPQVVR